MNRTKNLVITALLIAMGIVLPMAFHTIPKAGQIFLPMHIPVLLCGFICGPVFGALCGVVTPVISSLATGMPPMFPTLPAMLCELAVYGFFSGLFYRIIRTKSNVFNIYASLISAMLIGRAVSGFMFGVILTPTKFGIAAWAAASFVTAWPGIVIQIVAVPTLVFALYKARLISVDKRDIWGLGSFKRTKKSREYFDSMAENWDSRSNIPSERLHELIGMCGIKDGDKVLDIACGTGIIDNELLLYGADKIVGVDIAPKMIAHAETKNTDERVSYIIRDFYEFKANDKFDVAIIFNAFPHFTDRAAFIRRLSQCLEPGGRFVVLHSESADVINERHSDGAKHISKALFSAAEEAALFEQYFNITEIIDTDEKYLISGTLR